MIFKLSQGFHQFPFGRYRIINTTDEILKLAARRSVAIHLSVNEQPSNHGKMVNVMKGILVEW